MTKKDDKMHAEAYASGVLKPEVHSRLVADLDNFALDACILKTHIWSPLSDTLTEREIAYLRSYRRQSKAGVCGLVLGGKNRDAQQAMSTIAGFLVRNFVRARVVTLGKFLEDGPFTDVSAVLIPNFFIGKATGGELASWKTAILLDHLHARRLAGLQTLIYVSDAKAMSFEYGAAVSQFLEQSYCFAG